MNIWVFLVVFVTLMCSACTALLVPLRQRRLHIEPKYFKRVKVKFLSLLFVGIGNKSEQGDVKNFGVIVPMFVLHIVGYVLAAFILVSIPTFYYRVGLDLDALFTVPLLITVPYITAVVITETVCVSMSRKRAKLEEQKSKEE